MNRMEYCSIATYANETKARRVPQTDHPLYVRTKYVDKSKLKNPTFAYVAWSSWADDSSTDVVMSKADKDPELKYQEYVNHAVVDSADVQHDDCWAEQKAKRKDKPVDLLSPVELTSYDPIEGSAIRKSNGEKVLLNSRMDIWHTIEQLDEIENGTYRHQHAKIMYQYDPSPDRLACYLRS